MGGPAALEPNAPGARSRGVRGSPLTSEMKSVPFPLEPQSNAAALIRAFNRSLAIIEFTPDGVIVDANENFWKVMDYGVEDPQQAPPPVRRARLRRQGGIYGLLGRARTGSI